MTENELMNAVVVETGMARDRAETVVHSVVETLSREFQKGEPILNYENGTLDMAIDKQTMIKSLTDQAYVSAADAQVALDTIVALMSRV